MSLGRMTRLIIGVVAVLLGLFLMVQTAPAANADGSTKTVPLKQSTVNDNDNGCQGDTGVYFVITDLSSGAPDSISVKLSDGTTVTAEMEKNPGKSAHYSYTFLSAGLSVVDAWA